MLKRLFRDASLSLIFESINRVANAVLFVIISRVLGAHKTGIYSLAFSYTLVATRLTFWGLDQLLIRETSKNPQKLALFFSNFFVLRVVVSMLAWVALYAVTFFSVSSSDPQTRFIILLLGLSALPESVNNLCQAVFITRQRMLLMILVRSIVILIRVVGGIIVLLFTQDLGSFVLLSVVASYIGALFALLLVFTKFVRFTWLFSVSFCAQQLSIIWPLAISGAFYILDSRFDILILSLFLDETDIGIYSAAVTVVSSFLMVAQAYQVAVFPTMSSLYAAGRTALQKLYSYSLKYMFLMSLPLAIGLTFLADPLAAIFGRDFGAASAVLSIMAWTLPALFFNVPVARLLITVDKQFVIAATMVLRLLIAGVVVLLLVPRYQGLGAAGARVIAIMISVLVNYYYALRIVRPDFKRGFVIGGLFASLVMGATLWMWQSLFPWVLIIGFCLYVVILLLSGTFSREEKAFFKRLIVSLVPAKSNIG